VAHRWPIETGRRPVTDVLIKVLILLVVIGFVLATSAAGDP